MDDTKKVEQGGPGYFWYYLGTRDDTHYFHRQVLRVFYSEFQDGFYALPRQYLDIGDQEFVRHQQGNYEPSKRAFTRTTKGSPRMSYSIDNGIEDWGPIAQKKYEEYIEQDAPSNGG